MLRDVIKVKPTKGYQLHLWFDDGVEGVVDISELIKFEGVFQPLADLAYFQKVFVHPELATVCWPNDADLDSDVLYRTVTAEKAPALEFV